MSKTSNVSDTMPPSAVLALKKLGENLAIARLRRRESQRLWARRLGVSVPTLIRLEQGNPGVSVGVLTTALWMIGRADALPDLADPMTDRGALELDLRAAAKRKSARTAQKAVAK